LGLGYIIEESRFFSQHLYEVLEELHNLQIRNNNLKIVIFKDILPQHFNTSNGMFNGSVTDCVPLVNASDQRQRNYLIEERVKNLNTLIFWSTFEYLVPYWNWHARILDCTHFFYPETLVAGFLFGMDSLYTLLRNELYNYDSISCADILLQKKCID